MTLDFQGKIRLVQNYSIAFILLFVFARGNAQVETPNIILINVDDLGWKDLGIYGSQVYQTPNIDRLAQEGILFTQAYSAAANCAPSRACMLTGLQTSRHGIYTVASSERGRTQDRKLIPVKNTTVLADRFITIAEMLKASGYLTMHIGKWHLGQDPRTQGFDENIAGTNAGSPSTYFSPYNNPNLEDGPEGEYLTDRLTREAIDFIIKNRTRKFFLYLPYFTVHTPLMGKSEMVNKYDIKSMPPGQQNVVYAAMIQSLDENMGLLLNALDQYQVMENTLLIFTSDNGGICQVSSQSPLRAGKGSYYEGGIRVPLIIRWPKHISPASVSDIPVSNLDFFPTIKELIHSDVNSKYPLDGVNRLPVILNTDTLVDRALYWHFPIYLEKYNGLGDQAHDTLFRTRPGSVIRQGNWKLHEYFEDGVVELFDLGLDLSESHNLISDYPEMADSLLQELRSWRKQMKAPVPLRRNPKFVEIGMQK
ncbi:MAG: sulfatase [Saprospiraceae bacterium]|nr:sulfatase [Saprospiraceae bacterium]